MLCGGWRAGLSDAFSHERRWEGGWVAVRRCAIFMRCERCASIIQAKHLRVTTMYCPLRKAMHTTRTYLGGKRC